MGEAKRKREAFAEDWAQLFPGLPARVAISRPSKRPAATQRYERLFAADIAVAAAAGEPKLCFDFACDHELLTLPTVMVFLKTTEQPHIPPVALGVCEQHPTDRDRRELAARDKRWARERAREAASAPAAAATSADLETWLRARLDTERAFVLECVGVALGEALKKERAISTRELSSEVRSLRLELTEANEVIGILRKTLAAEKRNSGAVIDLPARRVN